VPVIVECMTDNHQRLTPEIRYLFKNGVLGAAGSNKFLFRHVAWWKRTGRRRAWTSRRPRSRRARMTLKP